MSDKPKNRVGPPEDHEDHEDSTKIGAVPPETLALFLDPPEPGEALTRTLSRDELLDADAASHVPDFVPLPPPDENDPTMPLGGRIDGKRLDGKEHALVLEERTLSVPKPGDEEIPVETESTMLIDGKALSDQVDLALSAGTPPVPSVPRVRVTTAALPRVATTPLAFSPVGEVTPRKVLAPPPEPASTPDLPTEPKRRWRWKLWFLALLVFGVSAAGGHYYWHYLR